MNILVLHGPNLNLLGERDPEQYGTKTLEEINKILRQEIAERGHEVRIYQTNHEGTLIDFLHDHRHWAHGVIMNPGALTHYSYALRDAVDGISPPCIEVHLSDISEREEFRRVSVIEEVCSAQVKGKGLHSYLEAIEILEGV